VKNKGCSGRKEGEKNEGKEEEKRKEKEKGNEKFRFQKIPTLAFAKDDELVSEVKNFLELT
jgi:hypothetical protein